MRILIREPLLIATMNARREELRGGHVLLEDDRIVSVGPGVPAATVDTVIDARGMVVLPGFVNTHHHLYQTLTRAIPRMQDSGLFDWLVDHYEIWRELTAAAVRVSTQVGILELLRSGVTTTADHLYLFPAACGPELIDEEIAAARELGIRFHPTRGSMSLGKSRGGLPPDDVVQTEEEIRRDSERLVKKYHDDSNGSMLRIALAPCSPFSVTPELMKATAEYAGLHKLRLHTHLAETRDEENFCLRTYGMRPLDYVASLGWLSDQSWFAHCVHLNAADIQRLGDSGSGVSHCPTSNLRLGSGLAPISEMRASKVNVSLAVDGSASNDSGNMPAEIRNALLMSRFRDQQHWLSAREVLEMATLGGAAVLGRDDIGRIEVGRQADLALFSMSGVESAGALADPLAALVFTVRPAPADYVLVNGRILVSPGASHPKIDKLVQEQNRISRKMLETASRRTGIDYTQPKKSPRYHVVKN